MGIIYCKRCLTPNSRPRIIFNSDGICNACENASRKKEEIDWAARRQEFLTLLEDFRSKDGSYDCVVPWSGGKDSSMVAYRLKFEFGMNPLLVTFSPLIPNEVGQHNREALCQKGFDTILIRPNQKVSRHLARRFFIERGNQKVHWDAGIATTPVQVATRYGIRLVFYAEHGETEYGGKILSKESAKIRDISEVLENLVGDDPSNWVDDQVSENDLNCYRYPSVDLIEKVGVKALYFGYFFKWSMFENYHFIKDKIDFKICPEGRTEGTFTNFDSLDDKTDALYYYMQFVKFGFGRTVRDASRLIQNGHMTREEGLDLVRKYDAEFPARFLPENLDYLGMTRAEFEHVVDKHRNSEIWEKIGLEWRLRYPPV